MSLLKKTLIATTALTLSSTVVWADGNEAILEQTDNGGAARINTALINQADGNNNQAGFAGGVLRQTSSSGVNELDIIQSGDGNRVGTATSTVNTGSGTINGVSVWQRAVNSGNGNELTVTQTSNDNEVGSITQNADTAGASANELTILQQSGDGNLVGAAQQQRTGAGAGGHLATLTQTGASNEISELNQRGAGNTATVTQVGDRNKLKSVTQNNNATAARAAGGNTAILDQDGSDNGQALAFTGGSKAEASMALSSEITQLGGNNFADLMIIGTFNEFGVTQLGNDNTIGEITVTGSFNELGIYQDSTSAVSGANTLDLGSITGSGNDIGVKQIGANYAQVNLNDSGGDFSSDDNVVWVGQTGTNVDAFIDIDGDRNNIMLTQDGTNQADIDVIGNDNFAMIDQIGENALDLDITGDFNGGAGTWTPLADADSIGLTEGTILQDGFGNDIMHSVIGDNNIFAFKQDGNDNTIVGSQTGVGAHEVAVLQVGNSNTANFSQVGSGNIAGISQ